jgi:hypothetical protein
VPRCPSRLQGEKSAALHSNLQHLPFWALAAESSLTYEKNGEREEFFLVLTLTKHFLHFF